MVLLGAGVLLASAPGVYALSVDRYLLPRLRTGVALEWDHLHAHAHRRSDAASASTPSTRSMLRAPLDRVGAGPEEGEWNGSIRALPLPRSISTGRSR
jgi:hypothetical protein